MRRVAFYPGSFDPVTLGHLDIIARAAALADLLVIGVGVHHGKAPFFSADDRMAMLREETVEIARENRVDIEIATFDNLTVDAAREAGASMIIRGLRDSGDFDYEMQMAGMNGVLAPDIETVFLASSPAARHVASSLVRQIAEMGGDVSAFVTPPVARRLHEIFLEKGPI